MKVQMCNVLCHVLIMYCVSLFFRSISFYFHFFHLLAFFILLHCTHVELCTVDMDVAL